MSGLAIAFVLAVAATAANAQDIKSEQSQTPAAAIAQNLRRLASPVARSPPAQALCIA